MYEIGVSQVTLCLEIIFSFASIYFPLVSEDSICFKWKHNLFRSSSSQRFVNCLNTVFVKLALEGTLHMYLANIFCWFLMLLFCQMIWILCRIFKKLSFRFRVNRVILELAATKDYFFFLTFSFLFFSFFWWCISNIKEPNNQHPKVYPHSVTRTIVEFFFL